MKLFDDEGTIGGEAELRAGCHLMIMIVVIMMILIMIMMILLKIKMIRYDDYEKLIKVIMDVAPPPSRLPPLCSSSPG